MRCRHQRAWPLSIELLEKPSCLRTGSERYKGGGGEIYANDLSISMLKQGKKWN